MVKSTPSISAHITIWRKHNVIISIMKVLNHFKKLIDQKQPIKVQIRLPLPC